MAYADILCFFDASENSAETLNAATKLATAHGALLTGVDASQGEVGAEAGARLCVRFHETLRIAGVAGAFVSADALDEASLVHSCVDLIVAPSPGGASRETLRHHLVERVLAESGAPVLMIPSGARPGSVGENVLVAWNGGREALRAVHDAMPVLKHAGGVTVFAFSSRPNTLRASARLLTDHLGRHGVKAELADWTNARGLKPVEALLAAAEDDSRDLIVAGAFGHSRLYEEVFGGVSVELLRQQSVPVLMSH